MDPLPAVAIIGKQYSRAVSDLLRLAEYDIFVSCFLFQDGSVFGKQLIAELSDAALRGVAVQVFLNQRLSGGVSVRHIHSLKTVFEKRGIAVHFWGKGQVLHSKLFIVDSRYIIIGSHNVSDRCLTHNIETSIFLDDEKVAKTFLDFFIAPDLQHSPGFDQVSHNLNVARLKARLGLD